MEINETDIRLANNTLAIDQLCKQKKYIKEFEIESLQGRIANVEEHIHQQRAHLHNLNNDLEKFKKTLADMEIQHSELIEERRQILGNTK